MPHREPDKSAECDNAELHSTRWSLVLDAAHQSVPGADEALQTLCQIYWFPLYAYARRRVSDVNEAQDLTQEFFSRLIEKNYLADADPARGRFRAFLFTVFKHFLVNQWTKARAQKRGGGKNVVSIDVAAAESRLSVEPAHDDTPQRIFDRQWAETLVTHVTALVRADYAKRGEVDTFEHLRPFISSGGNRESYAEASSILGISVGAARVAAHRLRQRYRDRLRREIAETVSHPDEVDDEIRSLLNILSW